MPLPKNKKNDKHQMLERRQRVASMYLKGSTQYQIAEVVGVSQKTVCLDLAAIRADWTSSTLKDFDQAKSVELAKLEKIEQAAWSAYERSLQDVEVTRNRTEQSRETTDTNGRRSRGMVPVRQVSDTTRKQSTGDVRFLETITRCVEMRLKVLGALKPQQTNVIQAMQLQWDAIGTDTAPGSTKQLDDLAAIALSGDELPTTNNPTNTGD